jgi:hypothetical protein
MKFYSLLILLLFLHFISCKTDNSILGLGLGPPGSYTYQAYDSTENLIVTGWFSLVFIDSNKVEGSWHLNNLDNRLDIGLQEGDGDLLGFIDNSMITINLNPQFADHNVYLNGSFTEELIEGSWTWSTIRGPTNWGPFKARKN